MVTDNGKKPVPVKKPARKEPTRISLARISEVRFVKGDQVFQLVPFRPGGVFILQEIRK